MKKILAACLCLMLLMPCLALAEDVEIRIWHDCDAGIISAMETRLNETLAGSGVKAVFEKKPGVSDQLKLYGNDAVNGPDLYLFAHDSIGMYATMGITAPITTVLDKAALADLLPMTVQACTYQGEVYALPVYFETLLMMVNQALWEGAVPNTTEELYDYMAAHTDVEAGTYALVNQHSGAYNVSPFIYGFGACILDQDAKPCLNTDAMKEAVAYNQKFAALEADGDYNTVTTLFNEGKAAAIIGGPWLVSGIKAAGIDLKVKPLSEIKLPNGNGLAPFSGVQGIGLLKHAAQDKKDAVAKVLTALLDPQLGIDLAVNASCAPANTLSYNDERVQANEMIVAIRDTAATAQPMPNVPQMNVMWGPTEGMLAAVNKNGAEVDAAAEAAQAQALQAVADMQ
ncbi:MAG: extracellular solute-binding protein [Clostridia bacterium]